MCGFNVVWNGLCVVRGSEFQRKSLVHGRSQENGGDALLPNFFRGLSVYDVFSIRHLKMPP